MTKCRPVILGYDLVSPMGTELDSQWRRMTAGESGISNLTRFPLRENSPVHISGEVDEINDRLYPFLTPRKMVFWTSPIFRYGLFVVHRALERIGLEITDEIAPRTAITFSSAIGGLDAIVEADRVLVGDNKLPHPFANPNSCINMISGKVSILTGATGPIVSTITACATGNTSMIIGAMFLEAGMADIAICGAVDFPVIETIVAGFATMNGAFKQKHNHADEAPQKASRPFSIGRRGFVVSEGAGCIVMATKEFANAHGLEYQIELAGWGSTADAHHFVSPNIDTVGRCMADAIRHAGIEPQNIDSVNCHAPSTKVGDQVEADALRMIFGSKIPAVTANKSQFGHAMGASSAIESVIAMHSMTTSTLTPTINYDPDEEIGLEDCIQSHTIPLEQEYVLKNAFGFGGCNACLVFHRVS